MREEFKRYLDSVGLSLTLRERTAALYELFHELCPEEIKWIFVTDYITQEGTRDFESLWFFSEMYVMEAKQFTHTDNLDMLLLERPISYWSLQKQNYDFKQATDKFRLFFNFRTSFQATGALKGSKENCDFLRDLIKDYFARKPKK